MLLTLPAQGRVPPLKTLGSTTKEKLLKNKTQYLPKNTL